MNTKKTLLSMVLILCAFTLVTAQSYRTDTSYMTRIVATSWLPSGKAITVTAVRHHKRDRQAPFYFKTVTYNLETKVMDTVPEGRLYYSNSSDGKYSAYLKRTDQKSNIIYLLDNKSGTEKVLLNDTTRKSSLEFSPDSRELMYNVETNGTGTKATLDIHIYDLQTGKSRKITDSQPHKSYNPNWSPNGKQVVYYFEKGDNRDQIYLTDAKGSFHQNLTSDTSTHNFFPDFLDDQHIVFTRMPSQIMMMNLKDKTITKIEGLNSFLVKYNRATNKLLYLAAQPESKVILYDMKTKEKEVLLDESVLTRLF